MVDFVLLGFNLLRCCLRISLFARSGTWEYWEKCAVPAKQKKTSSNEKTKTQKYTTNNKTRKPNHEYTNKTIKTWVSRHNLVVLIMGVCTTGLKVWNKDDYGRREYVQRKMYNLKLKWAIGKMKWYTVDINNSCFSTILSVIIGRDKYISVLFFKCELGAAMKRGINLVPDLGA